MIELSQAIIVFAVAFIVAYFMVPVSKRIAFKIGAVDYPGNRRINNIPIPRCGGIALYAGLVAACVVIIVGVSFFDWQILHSPEVADMNFILLFIGVSFIFAVGLIDDAIQLSPRIKFVGQILGCIIVVMAGVDIGVIRSPFFEGILDLGFLSYPLTVIYLLVFVNVINLIDGLDGLAAGIVAIVAGGLLFLMMNRGGSLFAIISLALIAVCLAFLRFNFYPASVFMGDSGSLLLGVMIGIIAVSGLARTQSLVVMLVPLVMAGVPILDTISAIIRRLRGHQPVQQADMGHIHHRLIHAGLSQRTSVLILYACTFLLAVVGCMLGEMRNVIGEWVVVVILAGILFIVIWRFGLFKPVLEHYYDNKGERGHRKPKNTDDAQAPERRDTSNDDTVK